MTVLSLTKAEAVDIVKATEDKFVELVPILEQADEKLFDKFGGKEKLIGWLSIQKSNIEVLKKRHSITKKDLGVKIIDAAITR